MRVLALALRKGSFKGFFWVWGTIGQGNLPTKSTRNSKPQKNLQDIRYNCRKTVENLKQKKAPRATRVRGLGLVFRVVGVESRALVRL